MTTHAMTTADSNTNINMPMTDTTPHRFRHEYLEENIRNFVLFMDTCVLMHSNHEAFFRHAAPLLKETGKRVFVPVSVYRELRRHAENKGTDAESREKRHRARRALKALQGYLSQQLAELRGDKGDDHVADNVFLSVFTKFRGQYPLMLLTNDTDLFQEIEALNYSSVRRGIRPIRVRRLTNDGYLRQWKSNGEAGSVSAPHAHSGAEKSSCAEGCPPFRLTSTLVSGGADTLLPMSCVPQAGSRLNARAAGGEHSVVLEQLLGKGGEGSVYDAGSGMVAKVFAPERNTALRRDKLALMLTRPVSCKGICYPTALLYNKRNEFVGYLMPRAEGRELDRSLFKPMLMDKYFPAWSRADSVQLCITILEKVQYLHSMNILLGDINGSNILVKSPTEVYFVDTDSYQVEGYPCPVGKEHFTAPEILGKSYAGFLRSKGHEHFALATLLFMVMMLGKTPYAQQGGGTPAENIRRMDFSYPLQEQTNGKAPAGAWRFMWSNMIFKVKKAFYNTFAKGGEHAAEQTRLSAKQWLALFRKYHAVLADSRLKDPMMLELRPTRFKCGKDDVLTRCPRCGQEHPASTFRDGICRDCWQQEHTRTCARCGQSFIAKNKHCCHCYDCFRELNEPVQQCTCAVCGATFQITLGEKEFLEKKHLDLPKRCPQCRSQKRRSSVSGPRYTPPAPPSSNGILSTLWDLFF